MFNTLQDDLYDNDQAEVLGRIQTKALSDFASWDWAEGKWFSIYTWIAQVPRSWPLNYGHHVNLGHFLVIVWQADMLNTLAITPYGDYYDMIETDYGDGDVQVWETFTDNLVLRSVN